MNGVHDMGGLECFGPVVPEPDELFHDEWEKQVLATTLAVGATGTWNLDESRFSREALPPDQYLSIGYYRIWLSALENLLVKHGLVNAEELKSGQSLTPPATIKNVLEAKDVTAKLRAGSPVDREVPSKPCFAVGDLVRVVNRHTLTHTRLPAYIRNHSGVIHKIHGAHIFPDSHAIGEGENPQWLYNVRFEAADLWGDARATDGSVHVDCWEPYLSKEP